MSMGRAHNRGVSTASSVSSVTGRLGTANHSRAVSTIAESDDATSPTSGTGTGTDKKPRKLSSISNKKGKKLSEKGKYKLADFRAQQMLDEWHGKQAGATTGHISPIAEERSMRNSRSVNLQHQQNAMLRSRHSIVYDQPNAFNLTAGDFAPMSPHSPRSPRSPSNADTDTDHDEYNNTMQSDMYDHEAADEAGDMADVQVWDDVELNDEERLELMRQYCLTQIETEEAKRRIQKHQRKLNELRNASKANQKIKDFNWQVEEQKWLEKYTANTVVDDGPIIISEPVAVIAELLEAGLISQNNLVRMLQSEDVQYELSITDVRVLHASLDASFNGRRSPLNFKVEMLWRFCSTIQDVYVGVNRKLLLNLAIYSYHLLIEKCDINKHLYQYSALCNCLELATIELNRMELREQLHSVNKDYEFLPPDLTKLTFEFKKSKALLAREEAKRKKKEEEAARDAKLGGSVFNMAG